MIKTLPTKDISHVKAALEAVNAGSPGDYLNNLVCVLKTLRDAGYTLDITTQCFLHPTAKALWDIPGGSKSMTAFEVFARALPTPELVISMDYFDPLTSYVASKIVPSLEDIKSEVLYYDEDGPPPLDYFGIMLKDIEKIFPN